jgi:diphosphoinositol-polyphosphate diphosphatase
VEAAAAREAVEEAGVRGDIVGPALGPFQLPPKKGAAPGATPGAATMFALHVREELDVWPERSQRARVWLPLTAAVAAPKHAWMRDAVAAWAAGRGWVVEPTADGEAVAAAAAAAARAAAGLRAGAPRERAPSP